MYQKKFDIILNMRPTSFEIIGQSPESVAIRVLQSEIKVDFSSEKCGNAFDACMATSMYRDFGAVVSAACRGINTSAIL